MKTLILHTPKGGSGKSTLTRELAVAAARGGLQVAILDLDPQGTTGGWYSRRKSEDVALVNLAPGSSLGPLERAGVDLVLIDTPPGQPSFLSAILAQADAVLVPVRPTPDDLLAAAPIARSLSGVKQWAFVLSQVPSRSRLLAGAVRQLAGLGKVAPVHMTIRQDYPVAAISGQAAIEFTGKAADESAALYDYAMQLIGD